MSESGFSDAISFFCRHLVCLAWEDATPGRVGGRQQIVTTFLVEVEAGRFLVTAAHITSEITRASENGQVLRGMHLFDGFPGSTWTHGIPFDFREYAGSLEWVEGGRDVAIIPLPSHVQVALLHNGKVPITSLAWRKDLPETFDAYRVLGVPKELIANQGSRTAFSPAFFPVERISEKDLPSFVTIYPDCFYGRVFTGPNPDGSSISDIDGVSGGPVLGFKRSDDGSTRYWVVAVQGAWYASSKIVCATLLLPFLEGIEAHIRRVLEENPGAAD